MNEESFNDCGNGQDRVSYAPKIADVSVESFIDWGKVKIGLTMYR